MKTESPNSLWGKAGTASEPLGNQYPGQGGSPGGLGFSLTPGASPEAGEPPTSREIVVDSFAGGGGASLGISWALGRGPDIAINHDKEAIALHAANHPDSLHLAEDVWHVDPVEACAGRPVGLMWLFSGLQALLESEGREAGRQCGPA